MFYSYFSTFSVTFYIIFSYILMLLNNFVKEWDLHFGIELQKTSLLEMNGVDDRFILLKFASKRMNVTNSH